MSKSPTDALRKLQFLRWMSWLEGGTLLLLLLVAVPLKRLAGIPEVVSWVGPVHGGAFLVYQFTAKARDFMAVHFNRIDADFEPLNILPCKLFWGWKE